MRHKATVTISLLALSACGALLSSVVKLPSAQAAPAAGVTPPAAPATAANASVADVLSGKAYPTKITPEQVNAAYHLVSIVDTQGRPGTYATKGETVTLGSETFLVAYFVPLTSGVGKPPQPKPDEPSLLGLINMRYITVLYDIHAVGASAPTPAPAKETDKL